MNEIKELREDIGNNARQNADDLNNNLGAGINFNQSRKVLTIKLNHENQTRNSINKKIKEKKSDNEKLGGMDEE